MANRSTRDGYGDALAELGDDERIVVFDADLSASTRTNRFAKKFPDRFFNCGIAEQNMMSTAAGMATCGKIAFASSFAGFAAGRAYDQIRNSIAYPRLNVKIGATHAGLSVGEDGATHQCLEDIAIMRAIPNMTVISPADYTEAKLAVKAAIKRDGPVYLRLGRSNIPDIFGENYNFEFGKGVIIRGGFDVTIIATGVMVSHSLAAADILSKRGISARVVNIHTIKPIDVELISRCAAITKAIVTVEDHSVIGGLGGAVAEILGENYLCKLRCLGVRDAFGRSGTESELFEFYGLDALSIAKAATFS